MILTAVEDQRSSVLGIGAFRSPSGTSSDTACLGGKGPAGRVPRQHMKVGHPSPCQPRRPPPTLAGGPETTLKLLKLMPLSNNPSPSRSLVGLQQRLSWRGVDDGCTQVAHSQVRCPPASSACQPNRKLVGRVQSCPAGHEGGCRSTDPPGCDARPACGLFVGRLFGSGTDDPTGAPASGGAAGAVGGQLVTDHSPGCVAVVLVVTLGVVAGEVGDRRLQVAGQAWYGDAEHALPAGQQIDDLVCVGALVDGGSGQVVDAEVSGWLARRAAWSNSPAPSRLAMILVFRMSRKL